MSTEQIHSLLDELPVIRDKKYYYTPAAVFGYIGYRQGFETEIALYEASVTPLQMVVITIATASLTNALINRGSNDRKTDYTPYKNAHKSLLFLSIHPAMILFVCHLISLYWIYSSEIYSETLIGLGISIYQALIIASGASSAAVWILYQLFYLFSRYIYHRYNRY